MSNRKRPKRTNKDHRKLIKRSSNRNPTKNRCWTRVFQDDQQCLLHVWHSSCYLCL